MMKVRKERFPPMTLRRSRWEVADPEGAGQLQDRATIWPWLYFIKWH
jgi:hypothetical protein